MLGFFPRQSGNFVEFHHSGERAMPWFALFNGTAAVTVFFVLSGLVLSRAYLLTGDVSIIRRGALKRWPRLAGPVVIVVVVSAILDRFGLYRYDQASIVTGSPWLAGHLFHGLEPDARGILGALSQGTLTFFRGDSSYDSSLWTMRYEMTGSYMVFGLVLILGQIGKAGAAVVYLLAINILIYLYTDTYMIPFLVGVCIAYAQPRDSFRMPAVVGVTLMASALFLLGYSGLNAGWYKPMASLLHGVDTIYVHVTGAAMVIVATNSTPALKSHLQSRLCAFLGWISFPIYLIHIPVLCSLGSATFLLTLPVVGPRAASLAALLATVSASVAAAVPLAMINDAWTASVDRVARRFDGDAPAPSGL